MLTRLFKASGLSNACMIQVSRRCMPMQQVSKGSLPAPWQAWTLQQAAPSTAATAPAPPAPEVAATAVEAGTHEQPTEEEEDVEMDIPELARRLEATRDDDAVGLADLARRLKKARWSPY